jgi:hypothetical protein
MSMSQHPVPAVLLVLCAAAACTDTDGLGPSAHEAKETVATVQHQLPAKKYALVLGNSLSFGWQPTGDVFDATSYHTGFSTLFVERALADAVWEACGFAGRPAGGTSLKATATLRAQ